MTSSDPSHIATTIDQFTRQSAAFAALPIHSDAEAMALAFRCAELSGEDHVLDVACGPGLVACAAAAIARHVDGIDLTPAMIASAQQRQAALGLDNLSWHNGNVRALPWSDGRFDLVLCRYAIHHFSDPGAVLAEMARVCRRGGRVMVIDATPDEAKAAAFDEIERLRDPSHTHALPRATLERMGAGLGLAAMAGAVYDLEVGLEDQLAASACDAEAARSIRDRLTADADDEAGSDRHGFAARRDENAAVRIRYPISIQVWRV